jgi:hypothetical protein
LHLPAKQLLRLRQLRLPLLLLLLAVVVVLSAQQGVTAPRQRLYKTQRWQARQLHAGRRLLAQHSWARLGQSSSSRSPRLQVA